MKYFRLVVVLSVVQLGLAACASMPNKSKMKSLNGSELKSALVGNSYAFKEEGGLWEEFVGPGGDVHGEWSGSGGTQRAVGKYTISPNGEFCETYSSGVGEWASPAYHYCFKIYTGAGGGHYYESTKNTLTPAKVGAMYKVDIKSGDAFGLKK